MSDVSENSGIRIQELTREKVLEDAKNYPTFEEYVQRNSIVVNAKTLEKLRNHRYVPNASKVLVYTAFNIDAVYEATLNWSRSVIRVRLYSVDIGNRKGVRLVGIVRAGDKYSTIINLILPPSHESLNKVETLLEILNDLRSNLINTGYAHLTKGISRKIEW